ncbi:hypothetical protein E2C01_057834 [Portunus trituberculatus]|uniref:Uncharacterized protein n=1 Tax=Portunus trituberculatus TaxID=210409 RepID=A0A5B7GY24_PORTR|nr:hypothetical protein [Portunus trituberculatus]
MVAVVVGGMLVCLLLLFMFARVCCQWTDLKEMRRKWRSPEAAVSPLQDLYTLSTYAQWVPTRLSPELFQASVHPYLLPSIPLHSVVATSSARNGVECPRPAPVFSESASAGRNPKSSVAWNCRLGAAVPLAARGLSTRPHVPPLFPPTGATLTENSVTRLADLPLAPVHCLPHVCISEARKARTRAWVLSQIEVQAEMEMEPAVRLGLLVANVFCSSFLQTKECARLQPHLPQQETAVQLQEEEEEVGKKEAAEEQRTAM